MRNLDRICRRAQLLLGVLLAAGGCAKKTEMSAASPDTKEPPSGPVGKKIMVSTLAGTWYSATRQALIQEIRSCLDQVVGEPTLEGVCALIQPHAGYRFSGPTAAHGLRQIAGKTYSRVVVMGPSHRAYLRNQVALPDATHVDTLLGEVPLDTEFMARLAESPFFRVLPEVQEGEHSVQIQIPLLQQTLDAFRLVPLVMGQLDAGAIRAVADVLRPLLDPGTLVIASTDFTHYGPNYHYVPFKENVEQNIEKLDRGALDLIRERDVDGFLAYCQRTGATICGRDPVAVLLALLPEGAEAHLLRYATSGRMLGDFRNSVSYVSMAFTGRWKGNAMSCTPTPDKFELAVEEQKALLRLARGTIEYFLKHRRLPSPEDLGIAITPGMQQVAGAFVTLHKKGQLRGCIGEVIPRRPVYQAVIEQAVNAAVNDYRFRPVTAEELPLLHIEISVLTPPQPVASYRDIVLGKHGIILDKQGHSALFLPQVAVEQKWALEETLTHLSLKAGLAPNAWREGARYNVFEALVFSEGKV